MKRGEINPKLGVTDAQLHAAKTGLSSRKYCEGDIFNVWTLYYEGKSGYYIAKELGMWRTEVYTILDWSTYERHTVKFHE